MTTSELGTSGSYLGGGLILGSPLPAAPTGGGTGGTGGGTDTGGGGTGGGTPPPPPPYSPPVATFHPPVVYDRTRVLPGHPGNVLMRHYSPLPRGQNVYLLVDGTVTTTQPYEPTPGTVIRRVFFGAHDEPISADEQALLTAAGYGANIS